MKSYMLILSVLVGLQLLGVYIRIKSDPAPLFGKNKSWRDVVDVKQHQLLGKTVVITGGSDGIGLETTKALAYLGARVIMGARDLEKAGRAIREIYADIGKLRGTIEAKYLDVSSLNSVATFAESIVVPIDILILNAGVINPTGYQTSPDGYELTFVTNYLGHFYLTQKLLKNLVDAKSSRVIYVTSYSVTFAATSTEKLTMNDFQFTKERFESKLPLSAALETYANSKVAGMLYMRKLSRESAVFGVKTYSVHPGYIRTNIGADRLPKTATLMDHAAASLKKIGQILFFALLPNLKSWDEGAATTVYCAVDQSMENLSGSYFEDVALREPTNAAKDDQLGEELWNWSIKVMELNEEKRQKSKQKA